MKLRDPGHEIVVVERNRPYDTFGWGVVLSDETLANLEAADPVSAEEIRGGFVYWDDIAVHLPRHGDALVGARLLRHRPQAAAQYPAGPRAGAGRASCEFETEIEGLEPYRGYDLIVAADGANSKVRSELAHVFKPDIDVRACKYIWLGTHAEIRRRLHLHLRGDRARLDLGARLPVRPRHGDLHRRVLGGDLAALRLRPDGPGGDDRRVREDLRRGTSAATG